MTQRRLRCLLLFALLLLTTSIALAQTGAISLTVDATQAPLKMIRTHMVMPVKPGPLTLYYPKWIPGEHEPAGPIAGLSGLKFTVNGQIVPWKRDLRDVFTFHLDIPQGASQLDVSFIYLDPTGDSGSATDKLFVLSWNAHLLYPAGMPASQITYKPMLRLPDGWKFGTALPVAGQSGTEVSFQPIGLDLLVDSPVVTGEYYRAIDLTPPGEPIHHEIDLVADSEAALAMSPAVQKGLTNLVAEAGKLFGTRHYRDYHFLLTLSDHTPHFGLEHHESSDNRLPERTLLSPGAARRVGGLLAHEFAHSWNGKVRRPRDLSTPEFETPMETDLLWVYEGNTSYLGDLLAARSGLWTADDYHQALADIAASLGQGRPGRTWRPLLDTAVGIPGMFRQQGSSNWRRGSDYYEEGELIWLEAANIIHEQSHGQKSYDDFAHLFYGGPNSGPQLKTYTFDELVAALNQIAPYNWAEFFNQRLMSTSAEAPTGGIEAGGWKLAFTAEAPRQRGEEGGRRSISSTTYTIGLNLGADGAVNDSLYDGPAFRAGVTSGMKVVGVNGRLYTADILTDAIKAAQSGSGKIELLVIDSDYYRTCTIDYRGGERYPHLVRDTSKPDYLNELIKPLARSE